MIAYLKDVWILKFIFHLECVRVKIRSYLLLLILDVDDDLNSHNTVKEHDGWMKLRITNDYNFSFYVKKLLKKILILFLWSFKDNAFMSLKGELIFLLIHAYHLVVEVVQKLFCLYLFYMMICCIFNAGRCLLFSRTAY